MACATWCGGRRMCGWQQVAFQQRLSPHCLSRAGPPHFACCSRAAGLSQLRACTPPDANSSRASPCAAAHTTTDYNTNYTFALSTVRPSWNINTVHERSLRTSC